MKLNKSILGSALVIIFLFSACSQAKYGNLTRRVKTNHTVQKAEKPIKVEEEQKQTIVKVEKRSALYDYMEVNTNTLVYNKSLQPNRAECRKK